MIEVIFQDGVFLAKGSFSLGLAGTFVNEDFGDENISIRRTLDEVLKELEKEDSFWLKPLFPYLKNRPRDGGSIAAGLAEYYNQKEKEAQEHIKEINDCLLYNLFWDLTACGFPFWEAAEGSVVPGSLDGYDPDELDSIVYGTTGKKVFEYSNYFYKKPNNGTVKPIDFEAELRNMFPMFNFDGLYENIEPEGISFDGRFMEFQFSDKWGACLYECAYDRFDENFTSCDWHNH